jgi:peptidoglycan/xylan/chitin deacetylase (PgdA/CDA1 family)
MFKKVLVFLLAIIVLAGMSFAKPAVAGFVGFGVDDGIKSALNIMDLLDDYKIPVDLYPIVGQIETTGYLTAKDLASLQSRGCHIRNHTFGHVSFLSLSTAQKVSQIREAKNQLRKWGFLEADALALPFGDVGTNLNTALTQEGSISVCRMAWPDDINDPSTIINSTKTFDPLRIKVYSLKVSTFDVGRLYALLDIVANDPNAFLYFVIHDMGTPNGDDYRIAPENLQQIVNYIMDYVQTGQIQLVDIMKGSSELLLKKKKLK